MLAFLNANAGALTVIFTAIVTLSTVAYAVLTKQLVAETRQLRRVETEPALVVYLTPSDRWINLFDLVIHNHGKGIARNLTWTFRPSREELSKHGVRAISMALLDGLSQLAPDQKIRSFFGSAVDLLKDPPLEAMHVGVSYENDRGEKITVAFVLDVNQFRGLTQVGKSPDVQIAEALSKLAQQIASVVSSGKISVLTHSLRDVERERDEFIKEVRGLELADRNAGASPPDRASS